MRRESRILKGRAVSSFRTAAQAFNGFDDDGRTTTVLLHTEHAFEMILKAALNEARVPIFDPSTGRTIGMKRCVSLAQENLGLSATDAGVIRAINSLRDDEQHYFGCEDEGVLYLHLRAAATLFDDILQKQFGEPLVTHLPTRVLPISVEPPKEAQLLIDEQFSQVKALLGPGQRKGDEARRRIRTLLSMEAHVAEEVQVSERDVTRVETAIKGGKSRGDVFPRLATLGTEVEGIGLNVSVRFVKLDSAMPVKFVAADDPTEAAAIREVDLQKKYHLSKTELAKKLGLSTTEAKRLRDKLSIESNPDFYYEFNFGKTSHPRFSDGALQAMRKELERATLGGTAG